MTQEFLFDPFNDQLVEPAKPEEPPAVNAPAEDAPRLGGQNGKILERLRQGPVTNSELSKIGLKYTSRLTDIRQWLAKWHPEQSIEKENLGGGLFEYWIKHRNKERNV